MILTHDLYAFPVVTVGAFLEGETAILAATALSAIGSFHTWTVFLGASLGTLLGDELVYWVGRTVGSPERARLFGRPIVSRAAVERVRHLFARHGGKTVFLLRYAYGMRTAGYFLAGATRMPYLRFLVADLAGTLSWVGGLVLLGLLIGKPVVAFFSGWGGILLGAVAVLLVALLVIRIQRRVQPTD